MAEAGGDAPWCKVKNPGCDEEEKDPDSYGEGWAYCTTDSASSGSVQ